MGNPSVKQNNYGLEANYHQLQSKLDSKISDCVAEGKLKHEKEIQNFITSSISSIEFSSKIIPG